MFEKYPHIDRLGHRNTDGILTGIVRLQEKVDGSQFSFGVDEDGVLSCRSRGHALNLDAPDKLFAPSVAHVLSVQANLVPGWIYRGEAMHAPKSNVLAYERAPLGHIALFDIEIGDDLAGQETIQTAATALGIEAVPSFGIGLIGLDRIKECLDYQSFLGGTTVEGVVIKSMEQIDRHTGRLRMAKWVSEKFAEVAHQKVQKLPTGREAVVPIIEMFGTVERWFKVTQHAEEEGLLTHTAQDIGPLLQLLHEDVLTEEADTIKDMLFAFFEKDIKRGLADGFPQWYQEGLAEAQAEVFVESEA